MTIYRVSVPATIYFDVKADDEDAAKAAAVEIVAATEDGDDFWKDTETVEGGRCYPNQTTADEVEIADERDDDDEDDFPL